MSQRFRIALLGGFEVSDPAGVPVKLSTRKAQGLLAYLAARAGVECERDVLAGLFWGDRDDDHARNSLRQTLFLLRRMTRPTEPQLLNITNQTVAVNPLAVEVDVRVFEGASRAGDPEALQRASELYRGDLLNGFSVNEAPFEEWLLQERERLREMAVDVLGRLLQWQRGEGRLEDAIRTGRRLLVLEPWQEPVHRTVMRLLLQAGQPGAALRHYQQCEETLRRELGVEPEAETRMLCESIRCRYRTPGNGREPVPGEDRPAPEPVASRSSIGSSRLESRRSSLSEMAALRAELSQRIVHLSRHYVSLAEMAVVQSRARVRLFGAELPASADSDGPLVHRTLDRLSLE
jgi:DNA-binding SARP family transcriptional activator